MYRAYRALCLLLLIAAGCTTLPDNSGRVASYAFTDTRETLLGKSLEKHRQAHGHEDGFVLLGNGLDAFVARAVLAEVAERSLDVQYYLYHHDMVGGLFTALLWQAAERGVRVRLLVDDMDMADRDRGIVALDGHPNIEIRIFNPFDRNIGRIPQFVTGLGSVTRRMHNKSFTADNVASILGGRNIGDQYFDADPALEFADLDVLAVGDVVGDVSNAFDLYWNSALSYPAATLIDIELSDEELNKKKEQFLTFLSEHRNSDYIQALGNADLAHQLRNDTVPYHYGDATVVVDDPDKITRSRDANELHLVTQLAPFFDRIKNELVIVSPYFVPGHEGVEFFRALAGKGVRVKILTNSLASNDVGIVHAGYSKYRKALLRAGVELHEMNKRPTAKERTWISDTGGSSKASLHAKTFVLDRETVFIGSLNLDPRSFYENTEIGIVLEQEEVAERMAETFDSEIAEKAFRLELRTNEDGFEQLLWHGYEDGDAVTFDVDPYTSFWHRFVIGLARFLPIESQL